MEHDSWCEIDDEENETEIGYATLTALVVRESARRSVKSRDGTFVLPDPEASAEDLEMQVKATLARLSGEREDSGEPTNQASRSSTN
jgi:hypothetical protein